jgi:hypothetical protein
VGACEFSTLTRQLDKGTQNDYSLAFKNKEQDRTMPVMKRSSSMLFFFMLVGGLLGGVLSEILLHLSLSGFVRDIFLTSFNIGIIPPVTLDLYLISFTLGFGFKVNLLSIFGIALGLYTYKQV